MKNHVKIPLSTQKNKGYRWPIAISVPRLLSAPNRTGMKIQSDRKTGKKEGEGDGGVRE